MRNQTQIFARNLYNLISISGKTQREVAEALDVTPQAINTWILGKNLPRIGKIQRIADYFGVPKSALLDEYSDKPTPVIVPILGKVAAGLPISAITDITGYVFSSASLAAGGDLFALRIKGDSMMPRIFDGDVVVCRQVTEAESGDIVIARIDHDDATCKKLRLLRDGIELVPLNASYPVLFFSADEIADGKAEIIGKAVEVIGRI